MRIGNDGLWCCHFRSLREIPFSSRPVPSTLLVSPSRNAWGFARESSCSSVTSFFAVPFLGYMLYHDSDQRLCIQCTIDRTRVRSSRYRLLRLSVAAAIASTTTHFPSRTLPSCQRSQPSVCVYLSLGRWTTELHPSPSHNLSARPSSSPHPTSHISNESLGTRRGAVASRDTHTNKKNLHGAGETSHVTPRPDSRGLLIVGVSN